MTDVPTRNALIVVSLLTLGMAGAPPCLAQEPAPAISDSLASELRLRPGHTIRVRTRDGRRVELRVLDLAPSGAPISFATVDSLWVRGNAAGTGAIRALPGHRLGFGLSFPLPRYP